VRGLSAGPCAVPCAVLTVDTPSREALRDVHTLHDPPDPRTAARFDHRSRAGGSNCYRSEPLQFRGLQRDRRDRRRADRPGLRSDSPQRSRPGIRDDWDGPIVVKGIQTVEDALSRRRCGAERSSSRTTADDSSTARRRPSRQAPVDRGRRSGAAREVSSNGGGGGTGPVADIVARASPPALAPPLVGRVPGLPVRGLHGRGAWCERRRPAGRRHPYESASSCCTMRLLWGRAPWPSSGQDRVPASAATEPLDAARVRDPIFRGPQRGAQTLSAIDNYPPPAVALARRGTGDR
jgi:hypothetical protein